MSLRFLNAWRFLKGHLSAKLAPRSGLPEYVVNDQNVIIVCTNMQKNHRITCKGIAAPTIILKTLMIRI